MKKIELNQNSEEWLGWRKNKIGASEAAAVLGKCKYNTPYSLWLTKTGRNEGFQGNAATLRGSEIEAKARASYEILNGFVEMPPTCVEHPQYNRIAASLDGLSHDGKVILEVKYPSEASHQMALEGKVPEHYYIQCQHQLMCVPEAEVCHYWSFREGNGALVKVLPDPVFQALLLQTEISFLGLIDKDVAPPLTERDALIVEDEQIASICKQLLELKEQKTNHSKQMAEVLKAEVIKLGGHNKIRCGNVLISYSDSTGKKTYRMTVRPYE
jgi:putative phage-type endonuclease